VVDLTLLAVAVLVAVPTALVGPITFLGLLVANLARQLLGTHRHAWVLPGAGLLAVLALVGGQLVLEELLGFASSLSVVVNFVGGIVFIALLTREPRQ
jgi:iron complex transport system permease protein